MPKGYISNRQKNLKVGISSYTESNTVLEVIGKVGIGTANATVDLDVVGTVKATLFEGPLSGNADTATYATSSGVSTSVSGGTASVTQLNVTGVSTFQGNVNLGDNDSLYFGDGNDLQIYHNGSNSYIDDNGTGNLVIRGTSQIVLQSIAGEDYGRFNNNGAVELYYDNNKKFETISTGVTITNDLYTSGNVSVAGTIFENFNGQLWNVVTQADVGYGASQVPLNQYLGQLAFLDDFSPNGLRRDGGGADDLTVNENGFVGIGTTNATATLDVRGNVNITGNSTFGGNVNLGDFYALSFGDNNDLQILSFGYLNVITTNGLSYLTINGNAGIDLTTSGGSEYYAKFIPDGAVELYYDNSKKFETTTSGITVTGNIILSGDSIGMGNDTAILYFNDATNQTRAGYWTNKDGFEVRGDSNSKLNVVLQTGNLEIDQNAYIEGILGIGGGLTGTASQRLQVTGGAYVSGNLGVGATNPQYTLDFGKTSASTIRLISGNNGTAIRVGAGGGSNDVTLLRVDGANTDVNGETNVGALGFSIKYMGSRAGIENSLSIFTDNGASNTTSPQIEAITIFQDGKVGINTTNPQYKLHVVGSFAATTKSFVIDHPTKEGMKLRYGSLEGPENGIYVRGRTQSSIIELPEYWTNLVDEDSITVNLTPIGESATPRVKEVMNNQVVVFTKEEGELDYYYTVFAERKDVEKLEVEF